jgi:hypothetical protein
MTPADTMRLDSGEVVDQVLLVDIAPISQTTRDIAAKAHARAARRGHAAPPAGGLFDDCARAQLALF